MGLSFDALREANASRVERWHEGADEWTGADWSNAMCGEAGEAANVVKKLRRHETRIRGTFGEGSALYNTPSVGELLAKLAGEIADAVTYADLLAHKYGIDLGAAVVDKFNRVSEEQGFPERLTVEAPRPFTREERERLRWLLRQPVAPGPTKDLDVRLLGKLDRL